MLRRLSQLAVGGGYATEFVLFSGKQARNQPEPFGCCPGLELACTYRFIKLCSTFVVAKGPNP